MSIHTRHSSRPTESVLPRAQSGFTREYIHGPLQPMEQEEGALARFSRSFAYFAMGFAGAIGVYHAARYVGSLNLWFVL